VPSAFCLLPSAGRRLVAIQVALRGHEALELVLVQVQRLADAQVADLLLAALALAALAARRAAAGLAGAHDDAVLHRHRVHLHDVSVVHLHHGWVPSRRYMGLGLGFVSGDGEGLVSAGAE